MNFPETVQMIKDLKTHGKYLNALKLIEVTEEDPSLSEAEILETEVLKCEILYFKGDYRPGFDLALELIPKLHQNNLIEKEIDVMIWKIYCVIYMGNHEQILPLIQDTEEFLYDQDLDEPTKEIKQADVSNLKGIYYLNHGDLQQAMGYYQDMLKIGEKYQNNLLIYKASNNMGLLWYSLGDYENGLTYLNRALEVIKALELNNVLWMILSNIAEIYYMKGDYDISLQYYYDSLAKLEKSESDVDLCEVLYGICRLLIESNQMDLFSEYFTKLETIAQHNYYIIIQQQYGIIKALMLKEQKTFKAQTEAQAIFSKIVGEPVMSQYIFKFAALNLCHLLLFEFKTLGSQDIFSELKVLVNRLLNIAQEQQEFSLLTEIMWLQSKIALIDLDLPKAQQLLTDAQKIATAKGYKTLALKISADYDLFLSQIAQWQSYNEENISIEDRLELAQYEDTIVRLIHKKTENISNALEEPILILVINSGITLVSKYFSEAIAADELLIGGFITAINAFAEEAFSTKDSIDRIKYKDFTIAIKNNTFQTNLSHFNAMN